MSKTVQTLAQAIARRVNTIETGMTVIVTAFSTQVKDADNPPATETITKVLGFARTVKNISTKLLDAGTRYYLSTNSVTKKDLMNLTGLTAKEADDLAKELAYKWAAPVATSYLQDNPTFAKKFFELYRSTNKDYKAMSKELNRLYDETGNTDYLTVTNKRWDNGNTLRSRTWSSHCSLMADQDRDAFTFELKDQPKEDTKS